MSIPGNGLHGTIVQAHNLYDCDNSFHLPVMRIQSAETVDRDHMPTSPFLQRVQDLFEKQHSILSHVFFLSIWAFVLYTGIMGVDFRSHWDEHKLFKSIRFSVPEGRILPGWYNYPSMIYDLAVLSAAPEFITTYLEDRSVFREVMQKRLWGDELFFFKLRARTLFLFITSLSILWTYLLVFQWTKQWLPALLSSAILASSWELAYHARWIAPDAILMQFGILTVLLVFLALGASGRRRFGWLIAAAVAAGLACATKYFGGIFLIPVFLGGYKILRDTDPQRNAYFKWSVVLVVVFAVTFLLITPGALLDTTRMIQDIRYEIGHYGQGDEGYTVRGGWEHLSHLLTYLFGVFFSRYLWLSLLLSIFVLIGLYSLFKENWSSIQTWVFLSVPFLFVPYMSQQSVMMVRNDLMLFPFLAILCARGLMVVWNAASGRSRSALRTILAVGLVSALLINFSWLYYAGRSISPKLTVDWTHELPKYLSEHQETTFYLTTGVRSRIDTDGLSNVVTDPSRADKLIYVFNEVNHPLANRPNVYDPIFGPYEVNFDYYPSWNEDERIVVMPMKAAVSQERFQSVLE